MVNFLQGKKTYIIMLLTFALGGYMALGHNVPNIVWVVLSGAGLGSVRDAISKIGQK